MLSEKFGHAFDRPLEQFAKNISFAPNTITIAGFVVTVFASVTLVTNLMIGGILVLAGGIFDVLDGIVARVNRKNSRFGAFLDSILDRYSDALILLAIAWNLQNSGSYVGSILCIVSLVGSLLISYSRARAEGLGEECKYGLLERPERLLLISFGAITGFIIPILWLLVVFTHLTVIQRIYYVWRVTYDKRL